MIDGFVKTIRDMNVRIRELEKKQNFKALGSLEGHRMIGSDRYHVAGQYGADLLTTLTPALDRIYAMPFAAAKNFTVDRIGFGVTALSATVGAVARAGIYNANQSTLMPTSLVVDGGEFNVSTTGGSTGIKTATISTTLIANTLYYFCFICGTGAPTIKAVPLTAQFPIFGTDGGFANQSGTHLLKDTTYGAFPSTFPGSPAVAGGGNVYPAIATRFSA